ncbi:solute carrier organic anion transporter family member 6A1 [Sturnira hondurensis]|uniref:solute carrier organic anion transporter family member 6A1 n=1 Tax=Sturnira hondurensis TaxID=192404 RepID=UPI00187A4310|nr:solute carrier organic anion transporter family member 6A1 [Sturnira hondurensis]
MVIAVIVKCVVTYTHLSLLAQNATYYLPFDISGAMPSDSAAESVTALAANPIVFSESKSTKVAQPRSRLTPQVSYLVLCQRSEEEIALEVFSDLLSTFWYGRLPPAIEGTFPPETWGVGAQFHDVHARGSSVGRVRAVGPQRAPRSGLRRHPPAMSETLMKVEPQATQAQPAGSTVPREAGEVMEAREVRKDGEAKEAKEAGEARESRKSRQKSRYIRALSISMIKFGRKRKKARSLPSKFKKPGEQNENLESLCGLGWKVIPSCPQFNNIRCFMVFFCMVLISQGIVFGLVSLSINTLESGNRLKTTESMVLSSTYDISSCLVFLWISYYGGRGNILKWLTLSSFLIGFGSLLFGFSYTIGENYQLNIETEDICKETKVMKACKRHMSFRSKYVSFFLLGQTVQGIAGAPLYTLGTTFVHEHVATHSAGIYVGLAHASVTIGYALGYAIAAPLNGNPGNSTFDNSDEDSGNNEHWLQTWWIRFVFVSVIAWSTILPFSCFPEHIRGTAKINSGKHKKVHLLDSKYKDQESEASIKDLFASVWILIKSPVFICLSLTKASESLLMIGASEILPKYLENQFILNPHQAATISGLIIIPGAAIGEFLGGVIVSKLHMYCKGYMRFVMVTSAISLVLVVFALYVHCNPIPFAGINENYGGTGTLGDLTAPCNSRCKCSTFYSPVCGRDDIGYFSPCFAGCTYSKTVNNHKTYFNCSCITDGLTSSDDEGDFVDARSGTCDTKCYKLPLFVVVIFSTLIFAGFSSTPNVLTILRIVPDRQRCLALGLSFVILRVFGSIPGPIVFRMVGESSCTFRDSGRCGNREHCWIYNKTKMAYLVLGICFSCKVCTIFTTGIAFGLYKCSMKEKSEVMSVPVKILKFKKKREKEETDA